MGWMHVLLLLGLNHSPLSSLPPLSSTALPIDASLRVSSSSLFCIVCSISLLSSNNSPQNPMLDTGSTSAVGSTAISMRDRLLQSLPGPQQVLKAITGTLGVSSLSVSDYSSSEATFRQCPSSEVSCKAQYHGQDTCCFNYPGGQMLQTQFWDADPAIGPADSWTIHGLW